MNHRGLLPQFFGCILWFELPGFEARTSGSVIAGYIQAGAGAYFPILVDEIHNILMVMGEDKALGSDGWGDYE